ARLRRNLQDLLLSALRDYKLDIIIGQGPSARTHTIEIRPFTLIGTATRKSDCSPDLLGCFSLVLTLQPYSLEALERITERIAAQANVEIESEATRLIATNSGRTPHQ